MTQDEKITEAATRGVLAMTSIELARVKGEKARAEMNLATVQADQADAELRFAQLCNQGDLSEREQALYWYLRTGRPDHLENFQKQPQKLKSLWRNIHEDPPLVLIISPSDNGIPEKTEKLLVLMEDGSIQVTKLRRLEDPVVCNRHVYIPDTPLYSGPGAKAYIPLEDLIP